MDPNYNQYAAQMFMDQGYSDARKSISETDSIPIVDFQAKDFRVVHVEHPRSWRITRTDSTEEQDFYLYGAICKTELPPIGISEVTPTLKKKAVYLRQGVRITGLRSNGFNDDAVTIKQVHELMKTYLKRDKIEVKPWQLSLYEGHWAVDANNRYFTPRKHAPTEAGQPFDMGVDPDGVLAQLRGDDLIHAMDNKVDYLREVRDENGTSITRVEPSIFKVGDIVRANVAFVGVMYKDKTVVMTTVLRALTQIHDAYDIRNGPAEFVENEEEIMKVPVMKRRRVYDEERVVRQRMEDMVIRED